MDQLLFNYADKEYVEKEIARSLNTALELIPQKVSVSGRNPELSARKNTIYDCGEVDTITVANFPESGMFTIIFTSGSTATVFTPAAGMVMPDDFQIEADTRYEINVLDGYALVASWAVSV